MTDFQYTDYRNVDSSVVDDVYFNANDNTLVIDLDGRMYKYDDVPEDAFGDLVDGVGYNHSVGQHYSLKFKHEFGPAWFLGYYDDVEGEYVYRQPAVVNNDWTLGVKTVNDFVDNTNLNVVEPTKEYSLAPLEVNVDPANVVSVPTREISLQPLAEAEDASRAGKRADNVPYEATYQVVFNDGKTYTPENVNSVDEALNALREIGQILDVDIHVSKVVVEFE